jgi:hypothetical protein
MIQVTKKKLLEDISEGIDGVRQKDASHKIFVKVSDATGTLQEYEVI